MVSAIVSAEVELVAVEAKPIRAILASAVISTDMERTTRTLDVRIRCHASRRPFRVRQRCCKQQAAAQESTNAATQLSAMAGTERGGTPSAPSRASTALVALSDDALGDELGFFGGGGERD